MRRLSREARAAATLGRVVGPLALTPPHRFVRVVHAAVAGGPMAVPTAYSAAVSRNRPAVIDDLGVLTHHELDVRVQAIAAGLHARGLEPGSTLGVLCRNHRGFLEAVLAGIRLGCRIVLLNTDFSGPQLADVCDREGVQLLIHDQEFEAAASQCALPFGSVLAWAAAGTLFTTLDKLASSTGSAPRHTTPPSIVLLTSGTTGTPKGARRKGGDTRLSLQLPGGLLERIPFRARRTTYVAAPLFHAWGFGTAMATFALGGTIVVSREFSPARIAESLERHRVDALVTVPILLRRLVDGAEEDLRSRDLAVRIIATSGSALGIELAQHATAVFGPVLHNLYGSTEVGYAAIATPADLRQRPGTVGRAPLGTVVRILDGEGRVLPRGETGRVFVDSGAMFAGYTGGGSKEVIDGMMSTGDLGHFDADGYLFVDGRADDMIVSGGENVFPREVEELLLARDDVADAVVVGVPDQEYGQRLRAYVVTADGHAFDEETLRDDVRRSLARYKVPREVLPLDEIPRNPAGKVLTRLLPDGQQA
ncbi:MAG TPA: AMP-binding protein [Nocardioidaceae bacterium]|nr:AMP-binding protein [Nocardioidaceae bacterium]